MAENLAKIPPQVPGKIRGHLEVKCLYFLWEYQETPPSCRMSVLVKWWGEQYKCCKICRVPVVFSKMEAQSVVAHSVNYCVCSSWRKLEQYLKGNWLFKIIGAERVDPYTCCSKGKFLILCRYIDTTFHKSKLCVFQIFCFFSTLIKTLPKIKHIVSFRT
jgi:hypothetical protein